MLKKKKKLEMRCCLTVCVTLATCGCLNDLKLSSDLLSQSHQPHLLHVWTWGSTHKTLPSLPGFPQYVCCTGKVIEHASEKNGTVRSGM